MKQKPGCHNWLPVQPKVKPSLLQKPATAYDSPEEGQQKRIGFMAGEFTMPDDFERILVAQAETEGFLLFTSDELVARYPGPVRLVQGN